MKLPLGKELRLLLVTFRRIFVWLARSANRLVARIRAFHPLSTLQPKTLTVDTYWLAILKTCDDGHFTIENVTTPVRSKRSSLQTIERELTKVSSMVGAGQESVWIPIWCLNNLDPYPEGVRSFLISHLPGSLHEQLAALRMEEPVEFRTMIRSDSKVAIGKSVIDLTSEKIVILGNAHSVLELLRNLGKRFVYPVNDTSAFASRVRTFLSAHYIDPIGTSLLVGGFGAIFGFVASLLFTKVLEAKDIHFVELMNLIMGMMAIIFFLLEQGFESRIVAFAPRWGVGWLIASWFLFLSFIIGGTIVIFGLTNVHDVISFFRLFSLAFICCNLVIDLGRVFFDSGLSQKAAVALWSVLGVLILVLPWMEQVLK